MQKSVGIILKKNNYQKQKITIFDNGLGKIEAQYTHHTSLHPIHNGSLLHYYYESKMNEFYYLHNIEIQHIPFDLACDDIYFLHHILELSYYFLPFHSTYPETFELLSYALKNSKYNKPIVLLRFFSSLGIYSENLPFEKNYFHRLLSTPFEIILKEKFDENQLKMLEIWLTHCKNMHPYSKYFKTNYVIAR